MLRNKCYDVDSGGGGEDACGGMASCDGPEAYPNSGCLALGENPGRGVINFDSIGHAMVSIFQTMTCEGWADIMYGVQDTLTGWVWIYFMMLIVIGPWLALNLFLVVISTQYDSEAERLHLEQVRKMEEEEAELRARIEEITEAIQHCEHCKGSGCTECDPEGLVVNHSMVSGSHFGAVPARTDGQSPGARRVTFVTFDAEPITRKAGPKKLIEVMATVGRKIRDGRVFSDAALARTLPSWRRALRAAPAKTASHTGVPASPTGSGWRAGAAPVWVSGTRFGADDQARQPRGNQVAPAPAEDSAAAASPSPEARAVSRTNSFNRTDSEWVRKAPVAKEKSWLQRMHFKVRLFAKGELLTNVILAFVSLNTVQMAIDVNCDYCDVRPPYIFSCATYKSALEILNLAFCTVFLCELLIKWVGLGLKKYFESKANWVDFVIVAFSIYETFNVPGGLANINCFLTERPQNECHRFYECEGGGIATLFRIFRLARLTKLLRAFPGVLRQIDTLKQTASAVSWLLLLILLFLFIFLVLGMNLFGGSLVAGWDAEALTLGALVFVEFPYAESGAR